MNIVWIFFKRSTVVDDPLLYTVKEQLSELIEL